MTYIKAAAIIYGKTLYIGRSHADIMRFAYVEYHEVSPFYKEGFVTDEGKFVNRIEAYQIAMFAGQLKGSGGGGGDMALKSYMVHMRIDGESRVDGVVNTG